MFDESLDYDGEVSVTFYGKAYRLDELVEVVEKLLKEEFIDIKEVGL